MPAVTEIEESVASISISAIVTITSPSSLLLAAHAPVLPNLAAGKDEGNSGAAAQTHRSERGELVGLDRRLWRAVNRSLALYVRWPSRRAGRVAVLPARPAVEYEPAGLPRGSQQRAQAAPSHQCCHPRGLLEHRIARSVSPKKSGLCWSKNDAERIGCERSPTKSAWVGNLPSPTTEMCKWASKACSRSHCFKVSISLLLLFDPLLQSQRYLRGLQTCMDSLQLPILICLSARTPNP